MYEKGFSITLTDPVEVSAFNGIIAGLAVISISISQVNALGKMVLLMVLGLLCYRIWQNHWPFFPQPPKLLALRYENQAWWLLDSDKNPYRATVVDAFVSRWIVIINFHSDKFGKSSAIVTQSSTDKATFRRLRCLLRLNQRP